MLVAIIFMWTPPHFWALSLWRSGDYARAGVPMLPVVKGKPVTRCQILLYTLVLVPLGVVAGLSWALGGMLYLVAVMRRHGLLDCSGEAIRHLLRRATMK